MNNILAKIREDLKANTDLQTQKSFQRFFKEQVKYYGVKTETVGKIAKKYWKQIETLGQTDNFQTYAKSFTVQTTLKKHSSFHFGCQTTSTNLNQAIWQHSKYGLNGTLIIGLNVTASATTPSAT